VVGPTFLDLRGRVSTGGEQGLLGLAFDPAYATNGRFVVNYTDVNGDTRISAFRVSADPDVADPRRVGVAPGGQPLTTTTAASLRSAPMVTSTSVWRRRQWRRPNGNGQSVATLLGKLLRVNLNGAAPYAVPSDNPFAATAGPLLEARSGAGVFATRGASPSIGHRGSLCRRRGPGSP